MQKQDIFLAGAITVAASIYFGLMLGSVFASLTTGIRLSLLFI